MTVLVAQASKNDNVNHPAHYTAGGIECIDALKAATVGLNGIEAVCTANAIKYLWRWKNKNGVEDLNKAVWYIKRLIKEAENGEEKKETNKQQEPKKRETCRERLQREHPDKIGEEYEGGCWACPHNYGYSRIRFCCNADKYTDESDMCRDCWDQEVQNES